LAGLVTALDGQVVDAPAGWDAARDALAKNVEPATKQLLDKLAVNFRDPEAMKRAYATLHDLKRSDAERAEAARAIALLRHPDALSTRLSGTRQEASLLVRVEEMRSLSLFSAQNISKEILAFWDKYPLPVRAEAINVLASRKEWAMDLLVAVGAKKV